METLTKSGQRRGLSKEWYNGFVVNKGLASPLLIIVVLLILGVGVAALTIWGTPFLAEKGIPLPFGTITFEVLLPGNTPEEDTIFVKFESWDAYPLKKVEGQGRGRQTLEGSVPIAKLGYPGGKIGYSYVRNNYHSYGTEYLPPEKDNPNQPKHLSVALREIEIQPGKKVKDEVLRWRWFPKDGEELPDPPPTNAGSIFIPPRVSEEPFQAGVILSDLWTEEFEAMIDPTLNHLKKINVGWIGVKPPWDYTKIDPLPKIENTLETVPGYPEAKLRLLIRKAKKAGFKVNLEPQICCTDPKIEGRGKSWYEEYARQLESWLEFHLKIANEEKVDLMLLGASWLENPPIDMQKVFTRLFRKMRSEFRGKTAVSLGVMGIGGEVLPTYEQILPILPYVDYVVFDNWSELVKKLKPSREEVAAGAAELFDQRILPFQQKVGKPAIMIAAYPSARGGAMGTEAPGMEELELAIVGPEEASPIKLDLMTQAWIFDALLEETAKHPFMVGFAPFAYPFMSMPKEPGHTVRGKPAEEIMSLWFAVLR